MRTDYESLVRLGRVIIATRRLTLDSLSAITLRLRVLLKSVDGEGLNSVGYARPAPD